MSALQIVALVVCLGRDRSRRSRCSSRRSARFVADVPARAAGVDRTDDQGQRRVTLLREFLGHTRMSRLPVVAVAHWFTMICFGVLFFTLLNAFGQLVDPDFALPLIGHFFALRVGHRLLRGRRVHRDRRADGRSGSCDHPRRPTATTAARSRFFGSTFWQAYYVELTILGVTFCIGLLRGLEYALGPGRRAPARTRALHFPLTGWIGTFFTGLSAEAIETSSSSSRRSRSSSRSRG